MPGRDGPITAALVKIGVSARLINPPYAFLPDNPEEGVIDVAERRQPNFCC